MILGDGGGEEMSEASSNSALIGEIYDAVSKIPQEAASIL